MLSTRGWLVFVSMRITFASQREFGGTNDITKSLSQIVVIIVLTFVT